MKTPFYSLVLSCAMQSAGWEHASATLGLKTLQWYKETLHYKATSSLLYHQLTLGLRNIPVQRDATVQSHSNLFHHQLTLGLRNIPVQYKETLQYKVTSNLLHHQLTLGFRDTTKYNTKGHYSTKPSTIYSITNSHLASVTLQSTIQRDTIVQSHQQFTPSPTRTWPQRHYKVQYKGTL